MTGKKAWLMENIGKHWIQTLFGVFLVGSSIMFTCFYDQGLVRVFAMIAILLGILFIVGGIFKPRKTGVSKEVQITENIQAPDQKFRKDTESNQYKILFDYLFHLDTLQWTVFSIFAVLNGVLISAFVSSETSHTMLGKLLAASLGVLFDFVWFFINARNMLYFEDRKEKLEKIETKMKERYGESFTLLWMKQRPKPKHFWENVPARAITIITICVLLVLWILLLLYSLKDSMISAWL